MQDHPERENYSEKNAKSLRSWCSVWTRGNFLCLFAMLRTMVESNNVQKENKNYFSISRINLKKFAEHSITDYKNKQCCHFFKIIRKIVGGSLLIFMLLNSLPLECNPFTTIVTQKELTLSEFKVV